MPYQLTPQEERLELLKWRLRIGFSAVAIPLYILWLLQQ
jgi:hypothetical protein